MKAILWFWSLTTAMLWASQLADGLPIPSYAFFDTTQLQDNISLEKRIKPSLSIVNPLDVLRQRLILEYARRQSRVNEKQAEINKAYLDNIGKRSSKYDFFDLDHDDTSQKEREQIKLFDNIQFRYT